MYENFKYFSIPGLATILSRESALLKISSRKTTENEIKDGRHLGLNAWNECFSACVCVFLSVATVDKCDMQTQGQGNENFLFLALALAFAFAL